MSDNSVISLEDYKAAIAKRKAVNAAWYDQQSECTCLPNSDQICAACEEDAADFDPEDLPPL